MKNIFISIIIVFFTSIACTNTQTESFYNDNMGVIPQPLSSQQLDSIFSLSESVVLIVDSTNKDLLFTAKYLQEKFSLITGVEIDIITEQVEKGQAIVLLENSLKDSINSESYNLVISTNKITISGTDAGLLYGVQTLLQIAQYNKTNRGIPTGIVRDKPRFAWRGMHLDESRHFFGVEEIKKYLDIMLMYKLNVFHWHLTDDQGWRIEIKSHPKLTEIGAWREGRQKDEWSYLIKPSSKNKPRYGGYYTQNQIREIIRYAQERFITIVPEIELPGHSWAALLAYPELGCSGEVWQKPDNLAFDFSDPFCVGNEETFHFFDDVLTEIIDLFPSEYIHIGGDECKKTTWEHCSKCQARMNNEGIEDVEELQSYFIKRIEKIVAAKGRKIIGWEEIMEGGLPTEAVVMSWTGVESGIRAAQLGYRAIMAPSTNLYFDKSQDIEKTNAIGILSLKDVYDYNPIPDTMDIEFSKNIIGVHGALWSEYIYTDSILETQLLPRLTALSEVAWSDTKNKSWKNYLLGLENQFPIFDLLKEHYFIQYPFGLGNDIYIGDNYKVELSIPYKNATIRYTLDGTDPDMSSKEYSEPFYVIENTIVKAKTILPSGKSSITSSGNYKKVGFNDAKLVEDLQEGIKLRIFPGYISSLNEFSNLELSEELIVNEIIIPEQMKSIASYGLEFTGYIKIESDGVYTFYTTSDDGSILYVDNKLIVDNDGVHGFIKKSGKVALRKGFHTFSVKYFQGKYGADLKVEMQQGKDSLSEITTLYSDK